VVVRRAGVVTVMQTVYGEGWSPPFLKASPGLYEVVANRNGAVCAVLPEGNLGLKPGEFSWVEMEDWVAEFWDGDAVEDK